MKKIYIALVSALGFQINAMEIVSESLFPLRVYYACPEQAQKPVLLDVSASRKTIDKACCIGRIELQNYPDYNVVRSNTTKCTGGDSFTILAEIDQVFATQAYAADNNSVLEYLIKNGLDPIKPLSKDLVASGMVIEDNTLRITSFIAPTMRIRVAVSGDGMQRYKAILPAAIYDGKFAMVESVLASAKIDLSQRGMLLAIADLSQASNKQAIRNLLNNYFKKLG